MADNGFTVGGTAVFICAATTLSFMGCGGITYTSDYDPSADFTSLRTLIPA